MEDSNCIKSNSYLAPGPWFLALVVATMGLGAFGIKSCSVKMGENHRTVQAVMKKATGIDGRLDIEEARGLAKAIDYEGPISNEKGELFRLGYEVHEIFGVVSRGKRHYINKQKIEDYLEE